MKKYLLILLFLPVILISSCRNSDEPTPVDVQNENTLFIYMPWSSNLTGFFYQNLSDFESCIEAIGGLSNQKVIVFMSRTATEASLFEIKYENNMCKRVDIKSYSNPAFTTEEGIYRILSDVKFYAPAKKYSMIIGCHGMGWLPVFPSQSSRTEENNHWDYDSSLMTRFFGGTSAQYQTDISTLSAAIAAADIKLQYILFDDCYMSSIEVAYELKDIADYLIASTCEVMAYGMPYATMGKYLLGKPDYRAVCDAFYDFYSNYSLMPCGTLSVIDLSYIDDMADIMKQINTAYTYDAMELSKLQNLDGYSPTIFYDFGDYVRQLLAQDNDSYCLLSEFEDRLNNLIPYTTHTDRFFTASRGPLKIYRYSGITTSDPSISTKAIDKTNTKWHHATH